MSSTSSYSSAILNRSHSSFITINQLREMAQVSFNRLNELWYIYSYRGILVCNKKVCANDTHNSMYEPPKYYAEWNKLYTK